jgi:hypothetical protein
MVDHNAPGKQTIEVWHETLGKVTGREVKAGQTAKAASRWCS